MIPANGACLVYGPVDQLELAVSQKMRTSRHAVFPQIGRESESAS